MDKNTVAGRILAIDYGDVRVGTALSDPLRIIASPYEVLKNDEDLIKNVVSIITEKQVSLIVLGWPLNLKGEPTKQTAKVKDFLDKLQEKTDVEIVKYDESLSTVDSESALIKADISRKKRKKMVDRVAASIILQGYMREYG